MAINREEYMEDAMGRLVPVDLVSDLDKARDGVVRELIGNALDMKGRLEKFKADSMGDVAAFIELAFEKYDAPLGGKKGNVSLVSYDGRYRVQLAVQERHTFGAELQAAKKLIDECFREWTENSRDEIKAIVNDAFQVDKEGRINMYRILSLRRIDIDHPKWNRAMSAISDALTVVDSKSYIRFYERDPEDGKWRAIKLDIAAL